MENKDLTKFVGTLVKVSTKYGTDYGMIDGAFGDKLGFVCGSSTEWETRLVNVNDVQECTDENEQKKSRESARWYYTNETESLQRSIKKQNKKDNQQKLMQMLQECTRWLGGLNLKK